MQLDIKLTKEGMISALKLSVFNFYRIERKQRLQVEYIFFKLIKCFGACMSNHDFLDWGLTSVLLSWIVTSRNETYHLISVYNVHNNWCK